MLKEFRQYVMRNFEAFIIFFIIVSVALTSYFVTQKMGVINLYYLPVLVAGYVLGKRSALLTSIFSVAAVSLFVLLEPEQFAAGRPYLQVAIDLSAWGGFLILTSIVVGTLFEEKEKRIQELRNAYIGVLEILSKYLESADRYTKGHSLRVAEMAVEMARKIELSESEIETIRAAALLHDVGKVEISTELLRKASQLSSEEKALLDSHVERGVNLLRSVGAVLQDAVPIILAHHRSFTGAPSPSEEKEEQIPIGARILAVADAFDAMTSDRPYRAGMPPWKAMEELSSNAGRQFDPQVVEAFQSVVFSKIETL